MHVRSPENGELEGILLRRLQGHPLRSEVELAPGVLPLVIQHAARRPGANPGAAMGILEGLISRAVFAGQPCISPDDLFHLVSPQKATT